MNKTRKEEICKEVQAVRSELLTHLIKMENLTLALSDELKSEFPAVAGRLSYMGISTVDNAIDDLCNGIGFLLEDAGFPIKGQM